MPDAGARYIHPCKGTGKDFVEELRSKASVQRPQPRLARKPPLCHSVSPVSCHYVSLYAALLKPRAISVDR